MALRLLSSRPWVLLVAMVVPGFFWALLDRHIWPWDQAQYADVTLRTLAAFKQSIVSGVVSMNLLLDFKPPGLTWLSVPYALLGEFSGRMDVALLCATLTWQLATLVALYWAAHSVGGSRGLAIAVAMFIGSTPLFIGMSHQFFVEPLQTLTVALAFLLALRARDMPGKATLICVVFVSSLAMAAKSSSPLYCALPLVYAALTASRQGLLRPMPGPRLVRLGLVCAAGAFALLVIIWYVTNLDAIFQHVGQSTYGAVALNYGTTIGFFGKLRYWTYSLAAGLFLFSPIVLAAGTCGVILGVWLERRNGRVALADRLRQASGSTRWVVSAAAIHLAAAVVVYSTQINEDTRFLEPLLPATAILLAWSCRRHAVAGACCIMSVALVNFLLAYSFALGWNTSSGLRHWWLRPVQLDDSERRQMDAIVALTCAPHQPFATNIVGGDYPALNHFSANFHAALAYGGSPPCQYASVGYAPSDVRDALENLTRQSATYYIALRADRVPPAGYDYLNRVSSNLLAAVAQSPKWEKVHVLRDVVVFRSRSAPALR